MTIKLAANQGWLRNWAWDSFWILGAVPLVIIHLGLSLFLPDYQIVFMTSLLLLPGHNLAPIVLAWWHREFRERMLKKKSQFVFLPLAVVAGVFLLCFLAWYVGVGWKLLFDMGSPRSVYLNGMLLVAWIFTLWNTWHFAGQLFGLLSIYREGAGIYSDGQRVVDRFFSLAIACALVPFAWFIGGSVRLASFFPILPTLPLAELELLRTGLIAITLFLSLYMIDREIRTGSLSIPRIVLILSQGMAPILFLIHEMAAFQVFFASHWLASIGLTSHILKSHHQRTMSSAFWSKQSVTAIALGLVVLSAATYYFQNAAQSVSGLSDPKMISALSLFFVVAFSTRFAISFLHFIYERKVYQFRDPFVRKTIGLDLRSLHKSGIENPNSRRAS